MQSSAVPLSVVTCNRQPTPFQPIPTHFKQNIRHVWRASR